MSKKYKSRFYEQIFYSSMKGFEKNPQFVTITYLIISEKGFIKDSPKKLVPKSCFLQKDVLRGFLFPVHFKKRVYQIDLFGRDKMRY